MLSSHYVFNLKRYGIFILKKHMSNRFIISEDEKSRILNLYDSAKKHHGTMLSEQQAVAPQTTPLTIPLGFVLALRVVVVQLFLEI